MLKQQIHKAVSERVLKFPAGPMIAPSPGPTFAKVVIAPLIDVIKSNPVNASAIAVKQNIKAKRIKKLSTDVTTPSGKLLPLK